MQEFMLFVRTEGDPWAKMSAEDMQSHVKKGMEYIGGLMKSGKLKSAQPLAMESKTISGEKGFLKDGPYNETKEIIAGYFHLIAKDFDEAVEIAKANPIFEDGLGAKIEIRPMKTVSGINN
ncbi:MAG TPA: YciI family protein [Cytophagaceae bacterium]|nr:YciI family protein [Cytophagaceae bacterium]